MTVPSSAFDAYWDAVDVELARYPMAADLQPLPLHSSPTFQTYGVKLTSIGPYRIFGYFSVPTAIPTPAPALLLTPRYGSVNHIPDYHDRERYVVFQVVHRGQRLADRPFAAAYPGLLTLGIADPERFIYRAIVADCLRGAEFLLGRPEVDRSRVAIQGDDLALITAARRSGCSALLVSDPLLYRLLERSARTDAYPAEEVNDFLRGQPEQRPAVAETLALFDAARHAPQVHATTLLVDADEALRQALGGPVEDYRLTHRGAVDHLWLDTWLAKQLDAESRARFLEHALSTPEQGVHAL
jgi:cephalosporin-C deacetylase